jgi:sugar lactone lactonase YvrE
MHAEQITEPVTAHGEGAVWSDDWGAGDAALRFVDMYAGDVLTLRDGGAVDRLHTASGIAAMLRPRRGGGFVVALERSVALYGPSTPTAGSPTPEWTSPDLWAVPDRRFNDGGCDPAGRLLCGTMGWQQEPGLADLWRLDTGLENELLLTGLTISNGLAFTPDGERMLYIDTPTHRIDVFDVVDGEPVDRRPFVDLGEDLFPDGLTLDADGGVWVALYGGGAVRRYDADGRLSEVVELPVSKPTSCAFGGPDLSTLYVTTSREFLADHEQPAAGALFAVAPGTRGVPVHPFGA